MKRKLVALAVAAGTVAAMSGCAGPAPESSGPVDLTMVLWSANEKHHEVFQAIADAYLAENADTVASISFETLSGDYLTTLTTQIAGGDTPDLAWIPESSGKQFVDSGVLADFSPAMESTEGFNADDIIPGALTRWTADDGDVYAYPFSNSPFGIYVNRALIEAAGQQQPADLVASGDWTWDAAVDIAAASAGTSAGPIVWSAPPEDVWDNLAAIWNGYGAQPWSEDGTECTFDTPEMNEALSWYHDATYARNGFAKNGETFSFATGGAAMLIGQLSNSGSIDPSVDWDFLPLPFGPNGPINLVGQAGVGVIAKGAHPDIAADFLAYFTNPENAAKLAQFFPPPRQSLLTVETLQAAAPAVSPEDLQRTIIDVVPDAVIKPASVQYSRISPLIQSALDGLWQPNADVEAVTAGICEQISPIIGG